MTQQKFNIRLATDDDLPAILKIWFDGIGNSFDVPFDIVFMKNRFMENFNKREGIFNFWVAVDEDNQVIGWQSLIRASNHPFRVNECAESSTYIDKSVRFKGLGQALIDFVIKAAEKSSLEYIVGYVSTTNKAARKITRETGWIEIGEVPPSTKSQSNYSKLFLVRPL